MKKKDFLFIIDLILSVSACVFAVLGVLRGAGEGQLGEDMVGIGYLKPYTTDSNIFMGLIALIHLVFLMRERFGKKPVPDNVNRLFFVGAVTVCLTFLTVVFFLLPTYAIPKGFDTVLLFFSDDMFFFHFLNPILAVAGFFLLDTPRYGTKENLLSCAPMAVYSVVYILEVLVLKNWSDFYGFTFGGNMAAVPFSVVGMYAVTFLIGFVMIKIKNNR